MQPVAKGRPKKRRETVSVPDFESVPTTRRAMLALLPEQDAKLVAEQQIGISQLRALVQQRSDTVESSSLT